LIISFKLYFYDRIVSIEDIYNIEREIGMYTYIYIYIYS